MSATQRRWLVIAVLVAFASTLLARWPLRWATPMLPGIVQCAEPAGSIWSGACADLQAAGLRFGATSWSLSGPALLLGRLSAEIRFAQPLAEGRGRIERTLGGTWRARDLSFRIDPASRLLPQWPATLGGRLSGRIDALEWSGAGLPTSLRGRLEASDLVQNASTPLPLGSFELVFADERPDAERLLGRLKDLGGPLAVEATLTLLSAPGYRLEGAVAARAGAAPQLARQIEFLGPADAAGRRSFSLEGTL